MHVFQASCERHVSVDIGPRVAFEVAHNDQPSCRTFEYAFQSTARSGCAAQRGSREDPEKQTFANSPGPEGKYEKVVFGCTRVLLVSLLLL